MASLAAGLIPPEPAAVRRTPGSPSLRAAMRAGMASLASGPIPPRVPAAVRRTPGSSSLRAVMRAGMASLASGPIPPRAPAAVCRTPGSSSVRAAMRAGMTSWPWADSPQGYDRNPSHHSVAVLEICDETSDEVSRLGRSRPRNNQ